MLQLIFNKFRWRGCFLTTVTEFCFSLQILKTIPWSKVNIQVLLVEIIHLKNQEIEEFAKFLNEAGFEHFKNVGYDAIYVKKGFIGNSKAT